MILCGAIAATSLMGCSSQSDSRYKHLTNTAKDGDGIYTDLGDYVIEIADYKDADFDAASKAGDMLLGLLRARCFVLSAH